MSIRKNVLFACLTIIGLLPCSFANAAPDDVFIFSGTRLPTALSEVGSSVSTITAEQIKQKGYRNALDVVQEFAGVTVNQNGGFGGVGSVRIRGALSEQTLVLIDGVPVNDPSSPGGVGRAKKIKEASWIALFRSVVNVSLPALMFRSNNTSKCGS